MLLLDGNSLIFLQFCCSHAGQMESEGEMLQITVFGSPIFRAISQACLTDT